MANRWALAALLAATCIGCRPQPTADSAVAPPDPASAAALCSPGAASGSDGLCTPTDGSGAGQRQPSSDVDTPRELIAVGDVHGDVDALRRTLLAAGVIDGNDRWIAQDRTLVFTGDLLDRGPTEQSVLTLVRSLQHQAPESGGAVVVALGNHELMNVAGDFRYVAESGWGDWGPIPADPRLDEVPEFARSRVAAFLPGGSVSTWLATLPVVYRIDSTVFVHGGLLQHHVDYGTDRINSETSAWIRGERHMPEILDGEDSPVWTRVWSNPGREPDCEALDRVLTAAGARRLVVGHTVQPSGINAACDGRVWRIDAGMSAHYGGPGGALRIRGDVVEVIAVP